MIGTDDKRNRQGLLTLIDDDDGTQIFFMFPKQLSSVCLKGDRDSLILIFIRRERVLVVEGLIREFKLQSSYYVHFQTNAPGKSLKPLFSQFVQLLSLY